MSENILRFHSSKIGIKENSSVDEANIIDVEAQNEKIGAQSIEAGVQSSDTETQSIGVAAQGFDAGAQSLETKAQSSEAGAKSFEVKAQSSNAEIVHCTGVLARAVKIHEWFDRKY
ncbi:MAG TPA: hypothetical protein VF857_10690 [Spirochaetota bacterium]